MKFKKFMIISCSEIASYFIWLAHETGSFVSNLKLQKLVYYAQSWHLALHDAPLFSEDFEAWVHGPVIPELYQKYKSFGWQPIAEDIKFNLPEKTQEFLHEVADEYFACDAYELEQMTHLEAPWNTARLGYRSDMPCSEIIKKDWMKEYYRSRVKED